MKPNKVLNFFETYFQELYQNKPYPWQKRLLKQVIVTNSWPGAITLPTGSGKTATIDIALFHAAFSNKAPRRIVYVVNRRLVVDQAESRSQQIKARLEKAIKDPKDPLHDLAQRLAALGGEGKPLDVVKLRGGLHIPHHPIKNPAQPTIVLSTIDQVGSRLLFRGYGLSPYAWPVEAGLLGVDTIFLLDEAHLERPFLHLLATLAEEGSQNTQRLKRPPINVVALTATPETIRVTSMFQISAEDQAEERLRKLWSSPKCITLKEVKNTTAAVRELATEAIKLHKETAGPVVIFTNRIDKARKVFETLLKRAKDKNVLLLTGRIRPFDRDRLLKDDLQRRLDSGEVHFVVSTQTLEVGADLSFTGLVTEVAPLIALFQRLGRLARHGESGAKGTIIKSQKDSPHPYTQEELDAAWEWLQSQAKNGKLDMSISELIKAKKRSKPKTWGHSPEPPEYSYEILKLFATTDPVIPQLEPESILHGLEARSPEVSLVWRADAAEILHAANDAAIDDLLLPPHVYETLEVPLWAAKAFLRNQAAETLSDLETEPYIEQRRRRNANERVVFRYNPGEKRKIEVIFPDEINPGDVLILPSSYGGLDEFGWNPQTTKPVKDVGEARPTEGRPPHMLRLHPEVVKDLLNENICETISNLLRERYDLSERSIKSKAQSIWRGIFGRPNAQNTDEIGLANYFAALDAEDLELIAKIKNALNSKFALLQIASFDDFEFTGSLEEQIEAAKALGKEYLRSFLKWLQGKMEQSWSLAINGALNNLDERLQVLFHPSYTGVVLRWKADELSIGGKKPIGLKEHQTEVLDIVKKFANLLDLPHCIQCALEFAAKRHDEGKLDPRMQAWLLLTAPTQATPPLAKSGTNLGPKAIAELRKLAGYPEGQRHELQAAAAYMNAGKGSKTALHLIGTHHGRARPFPKPPVNEDPNLKFRLSDGTVAKADHGLYRFDAKWGHRFVELQDEYGPWGLAFLEAVLRLADQRASED
ncbi:MAG: type I-U CRISPR-associated helicase/endonuclease Cas3 [Gammaproteobacteria bacterium]|nr:type I-U CRISPR-associated helicase/endonuclease Cas3 [Gammaproteobacteria bacterium]